MRKHLSRRSILSLAWVGSLLVGSASVAIFHGIYRGGFLGLAIRRTLSHLTSARPRFVQNEPVRWSKVPSLKPGFYEHVETRTVPIVHYVTPERTIRFVNQIDQKKLRAITFTPDLVPRLHPATVGYVAEIAALKLIKEGKIDDALETLKRAIALQREKPSRFARSRRPSFRLNGYPLHSRSP